MIVLFPQLLSIWKAVDNWEDKLESEYVYKGCLKVSVYSRNCKLISNIFIMMDIIINTVSINRYNKIFTLIATLYLV